MPRGRLMLPCAGLAPALMEVWAMAAAFGAALELQPFAPYALGAAVQRRGESALLARLHGGLLRALLADAPAQREALREARAYPPFNKALVLQQLPSEASLTPASWPEVLRAVGGQEGAAVDSDRGAAVSRPASRIDAGHIDERVATESEVPRLGVDSVARRRD